MAIESPLFQSAMELLGHSFSHFNGKGELDRKLVILHLANAIELILKDLVLDTGQSIYKNPKETITIYGCIEVLSKEGVSIPFLNKIELLIDERNALQHRFGSPNELTSIFYMKIAQEFFKEILKKHYAQDYSETISQFANEHDIVFYNLNEPSNNQELEKLRELAKIHPLGALLAAWSYFERITEDFVKEAGLDFRRSRPFAINLARGGFEKFGLSIPDNLYTKINEARHLRNLAAHGRSETSKDDVDNTIDAIEELEKHLKSVDMEHINEVARIAKEDDEAERQKFLRAREEHRERLCAQKLLDLDDELGNKVISNTITPGELEKYRE